MEKSIVRQASVTQLPSLQFAQLVWHVCGVARQHGLVVPGFRDSRSVAVRVVRRRVGHEPIVVIPTIGRSADQVLFDVVDGVLAVNAPTSPSERSAFLAATHRSHSLLAA